MHLKPISKNQPYTQKNNPLSKNSICEKLKQIRILGFFGLSKAQETKLQKPPLFSKKQPPFQKIILGEINVHEMFGLFMDSRNTLNPISKNHPYV